LITSVPPTGVFQFSLLTIVIEIALLVSGIASLILKSSRDYASSRQLSAAPITAHSHFFAGDCATAVTGQIAGLMAFSENTPYRVG